MNLIQELKRRNVFRVGIAYVLMGWVLLQGADFVLDLVGAPDWVIRALAVAVVVGLPIAAVFAWAFELTPEGIKRDAEVDRDASIAPRTGHRLDRLIIVVLGGVVAWFLFDELYLEPREQGAPSTQASVEPGTGTSANAGSEGGLVTKSIAVLPFADLSQNRDQEWFAEGLAEEILNTLARAPDLLVASRTASFAFRDSEDSIAEIGQALGVDHMLEGSVRRAGDRIRVTAQLIRVEDGFQLWSQNYDRDMSDVISIQEDLAVAIARALETTMDPDALQAMLRAGTRSVEAYEHYLNGLSLEVKAEHGENFDAREAAYAEFEAARTLDPGFSEAHARAAQYWYRRVSISMRGVNADLAQAEKMSRFRERIQEAIRTARSPLQQEKAEAILATAEGRLRDVLRLAGAVFEQRPLDEDNFSTLSDAAVLLADRELLNRLVDHAWTLREQNIEWAQDYLYYEWRITGQARNHAEFVDNVMALTRRYPQAGLLYQAHRTLLWIGETERAAELLRLIDVDTSPSMSLLKARQACAEERRDDAEAILEAHKRRAGEISPADFASVRWHLEMMLGNPQQAAEALRPFESTDAPMAVSNFMLYPQFDPTPFPVVMTTIQRENVDRPAPILPGFQCPPPEQTSIAVLPFVNMSADPENEYFSDGVSEEILNVLAAIPELKVASRTSAFRFKGSDLGVDQIAEALSVTHVLEGSVRKAGDQVRITAQLIQADDGFHLWSETYDRQLDNIFAIQDEIAGNIAGVLEVQLLGSGKAYTTVHDLSPADYEKFLKARFLLRQRNDAAMAEAIELTSEVLANNPDFPIGLTQLAEGLVQTDREDGVDQTPEIRTLTDRALALEPDLAPAHMLEGQLAMDDLRPLEALRHFERAIALDPNEPRPHHWLGILLANSGYLDRARSELETAVELEPDHANANGYLGFVLLLQGDYDGAQRQFERQDRLGNPFGAQRQVQVAALKGNRGLAEQLVRERDGFTAIEAERLQHFIAALQDPAAINAYVAFIDQYAMDDWHVALELSILGQYERALAFDFGGYPRWSWADRFVEARALPAFQQKIERANLPEVWDAIGPPPACRKTVNGYDCANGELP